MKFFWQKNDEKMLCAKSAIILSIVFGALSGLIAGAFISANLFSYLNRLDAESFPPRLSEEKPRSIATTRTKAIEQIKTRISPALVRFYNSQESATSVSAQIYDPQSALGSGVLITSDGWVLTDADVVLPARAQNIVAIISGKVYEIDKTVEDKKTGIVMAHVSGDNFSVATFGQSADIGEGDDVYVAPAKNSIMSTTIESVNKIGAISMAEISNEFFVLGDAVGAGALGAPVANANGELIGIVRAHTGAPTGAPTALGAPSASGDRQTAIPLNNILPIIDSVLKTGEVKRAYLGISVINLADTVGLSETVTRNRNQGALIAYDSKTRGAIGVAVGSPAALAGLKVGDIILTVNGEAVNYARSLDEILSAYKPGAEITVRVDRAGDEADFKIILGELK